MFKESVFALIFALLLSSLTIAVASTENRVLGIREGDWFTYRNFVASWNSSFPEGYDSPRKEYLDETNATEWWLMSVQQVSDTLVFFQSTKHLTNGSETIETLYKDIDTGIGNMSAMVVASNLTINDSAYTDLLFSGWNITETVYRDYPEETRETNHVNLTLTLNTSYPDSPILNGTECEYTDYYWDKTTGILTEYSFTGIEKAGEYTMNWSMSYKLAESNTWTVPEFPALPPIMLALTLIAIVTIAYRRRVPKKGIPDQ